jgi:hypothetical protein
LGAGGGCVGCVDDVALGVEEVVGFAGGALEVGDAAALCVGGAGAAEVASYSSEEEEGHLHSCGGGLGGVQSSPVQSSRKGGVIAGSYESWLRCGTCSVADESEVDAPSRATCRMRLGGEMSIIVLDLRHFIVDRTFGNRVTGECEGLGLVSDPSLP